MKEDILNSYNKVSKCYIGNSNSLHKLGTNSKKLEEAAGKQILEVLNLSDYDVIYTSGNSESFSTLLFNAKGNVFSDNEDIISMCEDMNICVSDDNVYLYSTKGNVLKDAKYNHIDLDLNNSYDNLQDYDFITIEDEIPFFGVLLKKKNIEIVPLINGGKSSTKYRSGTSSTPLIVSFSKLVKLKYSNSLK